MAFLKTLGSVIVLALWYAVFYLAIGAIGFGIVYIIAALVDAVFDTDARGGIARLRTSIFGKSEETTSNYVAPKGVSPQQAEVLRAAEAARAQNEATGPSFVKIDGLPDPNA